MSHGLPVIAIRCQDRKWLPEMSVPLAMSQRSEERHFAGQFGSQSGRVNQATSFEQIQENLAIRAAAIGRNHGPMDHLSQTRMIDERAFLFREAHGRQDIFGPLAGRRSEEILHCQKWYAAQRLRLIFADPAFSARWIACRKIQGLHFSRSGRTQHLIEANYFSL